MGRRLRALEQQRQVQPSRPGANNDLTATVKAARKAHTGVWAVDKTQSGVNVQSLARLTDQAVILPKRFRRLTSYLHLSTPDG